MPSLPTRRLLALCVGVVAMLGSEPACAWGASGHRFIARAGVAALPAELPAFLRTPLVLAEIGELAREPDRTKGAGAPHDPDSDTAHFINLDDTAHVVVPPTLDPGPALDALPKSRADLDATLTRAGIDPGHAGWLPYAIADGYQGLVKDFAYWRILQASVPRTPDAKTRAWFVADLHLREALIVHDLGVWAHYVGDASQPMHVSMHYNGWGAFPNPQGYTQDRIHAPFEGEFVRANLSESAVAAAMTPSAVCEAPIQVCTTTYLAATLAQVEPLYALWTAGGFQPGDARGRAFALARVAAGADAVRDLVIKAWRASASASIGRPAIYVRDVERGQLVVRLEDIYGDD